ncbi:MAG: VWA domain-containing protein [Hormoscilla sp. GUM202]|nr:VWA domain-containing protein [Hormoscilla sp. GUM202]
MSREALVVGINRYPLLKDPKTKKPQNLSLPAADAEAVARVLESYGNFRVRRMPETYIDGARGVDDDPSPMKLPKLTDLQEEIALLFNPPSNVPDTALLYFAGHGLRSDQREKGKSENQNFSALQLKEELGNKNMGNISTIPVIDTSNSMSFNGYVNITRRASKAYMSYPIPGDKIAVVNYDTRGVVAYSDNNKLATVNANLDRNRAAANVIEGLTFTGSSTNIGDGIIKAKNLLDPASGPRGIVLLTDGYKNAGPDVLSTLPSGYPVYACAMGDDADHDLLKEVAKQTDGKYYLAPFPSTMMHIYNDIHGQASFINTVENKLNTLTAEDFRLLPGIISPNNLMLQIGVVWDDDSFKYTNTPAPNKKEISITLVNPKGETLTNSPTIIGEGYVVFNFDKPADGKWQVQLICGGDVDGKGFTVTTGIFEYADSSSSAIKLSVNALTGSSNLTDTGSSYKYNVRVTQNEAPIEDLEIQASVIQPALSIPQALEKFQSELKTVEPEQTDIARGISEDVARLKALRKRKLPDGDILPVRRYPVLQHTPDGNGSFVGKIQDTGAREGSLVTVTVTGKSPITGKLFQRTELVAY